MKKKNQHNCHFTLASAMQMAADVDTSINKAEKPPLLFANEIMCHFIISKRLSALQELVFLFLCSAAHCTLIISIRFSFRKVESLSTIAICSFFFISAIIPGAGSVYKARLSGSLISSRILYATTLSTLVVLPQSTHAVTYHFRLYDRYTDRQNCDKSNTRSVAWWATNTTDKWRLEHSELSGLIKNKAQNGLLF